MKILVIGNLGQLGWELERTLLPLADITAVDFPDIDLTQPDSISSWTRSVAPNIIVNAAAYTAVDQAEDEIDLARKVNSTAPGILAEEAQKLNASLIHFSTDYVFDGTSRQPYQETALTAPINIYGKSKLDGEEAILQIGGKSFIFRTCWLYSTRRDCFVTKVLQWARKNEVLRIVTDQVGSPTWSRTLAESTAHAILKMNLMGESWEEEKSGIYHVAGNGAVSRFDWAKEILDLDPKKGEQVTEILEEAKSTDFQTRACRPKYSVLDCSLFQETFNSYLCDWNEALKLALSIA